MSENLNQQEVYNLKAYIALVTQDLAKSCVGKIFIWVVIAQKTINN